MPHSRRASAEADPGGAFRVEAYGSQGIFAPGPGASWSGGCGFGISSRSWRRLCRRGVVCEGMFIARHEAGHRLYREPLDISTRGRAGRIAGQGNRSLCRGTIGGFTNRCWLSAAVQRDSLPSNCCRHHYVIARPNRLDAFFPRSRAVRLSVFGTEETGWLRRFVVAIDRGLRCGSPV